MNNTYHIEKVRANVSIVTSHAHITREKPNTQTLLGLIGDLMLALNELEVRVAECEDNKKGQQP